MGKHGLKRGEHTEAGQARALANLEAPGEGNLRHQGFRFLNRGLWPVCARCAVRDECPDYNEHGTCAQAERAQQAITQAVMALPHIRPEDAPIADEYAKLSVFLSVVDCFLARHGALLGDGTAAYAEAQPILKQRAQFSKLRLEHARELGLTPAARKRLEAEHTADTGLALIAAMREEYGSARVIDAAPEPDDEEGPEADDDA